MEERAHDPEFRAGRPSGAPFRVEGVPGFELSQLDVLGFVVGVLVALLAQDAGVLILVLIPRLVLILVPARHVGPT